MNLDIVADFLLIPLIISCFDTVNKFKDVLDFF